MNRFINKLQKQLITYACIHGSDTHCLTVAITRPASATIDRYATFELDSMQTANVANVTYDRWPATRLLPVCAHMSSSGGDFRPAMSNC